MSTAGMCSEMKCFPSETDLPGNGGMNTIHRMIITSQTPTAE
jgi:hypothetical protein